MANYEDKWCQEAYDKGVKEGRDFEKGKLIEAKEIIKLLLWDLRNRSYEPVKDVERAEQFLKGTEEWHLRNLYILL